ncbi:MAG TPA: tetratricopeptide repeat protein [Methylomirabilota bacterium]|jgi:regulator of sirC expression with transglutaminase-like and TPR domain|nr:tetratricopeptide repeat protein [Methylomirabilota bacterium]
MADPQRLQKLARAPEGAIRLAEAALWIATGEYPDLDIAAWLRILDALGRRAAERVTSGMPAGASAAALNAFLFEEEGFRGNAEDYHDPRNSFLNDVLERRLGIPITLSVVYIEVAAAAGLTVRGIGLPGHFVVRLEHQGEAKLLDPFHRGRSLTHADCHALVQRVSGAGVPFDPGYLRPVTTREIVVRMFRNLKGIYLARGDWARALRAVEPICLLAPEALAERRDRGTIHAKLGESRAAIRDWEAYLQGEPGASDAEQVRQNLRALRQALAVLN